MKLFRTNNGCIVEHPNQQYYRIENVDGADWDSLFALEDLHSGLTAIIKDLTPSTAALDPAELLAPISHQEVWAAGVTYYRSRGARMEECKRCRWWQLLRPRLLCRTP